MTWSFTGISYPVELVYTQTRGVAPDSLMLTFLPQTGNLPASGTATLQWDADSVTLPSCFVDVSTLQVHPRGVVHTVLAWDRRYYWQYAQPISGYYNVLRVGARVSAKEKTLRQLCELLLQQMGEATPDVSGVPATLYPEVRWECEQPHLMLEQLMQEHSLVLVLGFGSETVKVTQAGSGAALPTTNIFSSTLTGDAKVRPRWVRTCFGASRMQARFKLEAVGLEDRSTWLPIDDLTYRPTTTNWTKEDPYSFPTVRAVAGEEDHALAMASVFRAYRISAFSDDSLTLPDGSGTISSVEQVLPLLGKLLDTEDPRTGTSYKPVRLFGAHWREVSEQGQPDKFENTAVDFEITHYNFSIDLQNGMIFFHEPVFQVLSEEFVPAELYLEVSFNVRSATNFAPLRKEIDVSLDTSGTGYLSAKRPEIFYKSVVSYNSTHAATGSTNNQSDLNAIAAAQAAVVAASLSASFGQVTTYSIPKLNVRLDGAIAQVRHAITNGEKNDPVNRTTASRFIEFDRRIPSRSQRVAHAQSLMSMNQMRWQEALRRREDPGDE